MSDGMNKAFLADPVGFARQHILLPEGNLKGNLKNHGNDFHSVPSDERIVYCDIQMPGRNPNVTTPGVYTIRFDRKKHSNWIPAFWLPWDQGMIYKCTLKDSRSGFSRLGDEVSIFFTAALDGCSVIVEGVPDKPSVYHANAAEPGGINGPGFHNPNNLPDPGYGIRRARMDFMRDDLFGNTHAPSRGLGLGARAVEGRHYMANFTKTANVGKLQNALNPVLVNEGMPLQQGQISKTTKVYDSKTRSAQNQTITQNLSEVKYKHEGTVFGVKGNAGWQFYYQRRVTATVWQPRPGAQDPSKWDSWEARDVAYPTKVAQFWPGGGGVATSR